MGAAMLLSLPLPAPGQQGMVQPAGWRRPACPCPAPRVLPEPPESPPPPAGPEQPPATTPAPDSAVEPDLSPEQFAATGGGETFAAMSSAVGYIDPALPITRIRLRVDAAYGDSRPDRAEFLYPKEAALGGPGPARPGNLVDYQDIRTYLEAAYDHGYSLFVELPVRFLNPGGNANASGFADMNAGFKYALLSDEDKVFTFQFRTYIPTGDASLGLGTHHVSLEPGFLGYWQATERIGLASEFKDWIPVDGTDFAGNILQYGAGLNYLLFDTGRLRMIPVAEFVGWTVLGGKETVVPPGAIQSAAGDSILNAKVGIRTGFGQRAGTGLLSDADLYLGYGRALTGEVWYKDLMRMEFRLNF
ncbi:MAG: hypothetical protein AB7K24_12810 [Gemmataceae bacterium]